MKLIAEYTDSNIECYTEATKNGGKQHVIEGVFMQADKKNRNGRVYEKSILESAVKKYIDEQVSKGRAVGELNHPDGPTINLDKVSHKITELRFEGSDVYGKASILKTPMGQIVEGLLDGGVKLGVSSRGMGSLEQKNGTSYVGKDFMLATVDIVQDPSAPGAFVNGIMEGVNWIWDNGIFVAEDLEKIETEIKRTPSKHLAEAEIKAFKNFLSKL
ncbi:primosomal protein [bacterium TMED181]|nr:MAG: primosomal protein [bacterium TMED181]OUW43021.1 MAG: primosomal protein [bacterium TMED181]